jgi:uncharacterized protein with von Willebrand factor type A (vWA) domain
VPDPKPPNDAARAAVGFARLLRGAGLRVPTGSTLTFAEALGVVGWGSGDDVYWSARATLCNRPEDVERFDECFHAWFTARSGSDGLGGAPVAVGAVVALDAPGTEAPGRDADAEEPEALPILTVRFSRAETLRTRDFATYSSAEHDEARRVLADLRFAGARRRSRRLTHGGRARRRPDVRRTMRAALRTEGEPLVRAWRAPSERARRLVVLCDVSGSMEPYARVLVRFLHSAVVARTQVEAFAFGTRLTRITRELSNRDPDAAIAAAAARVVDWSGGTRIGAALHTFNATWGMRGIARGAVVVIVSDGWDRGEPELLAEEMARLARVAHRIIWVNPLKASPGFAPLAAGMAAALPYVDDFVEGHSIASLTELAAIVDAVDDRPRAGARR